MEKNLQQSFYLTLSKKALELVKDRANKEAISSVGKDGKDDLYFPDCSQNIEELYFDKDEQAISFCGEFNAYEEKLGYVSYNLKIGDETVIEIIEHYMKKLGKLKTVMEAIK